jgi:hypothetical protein
MIQVQVRLCRQYQTSTLYKPVQGEPLNQIMNTVELQILPSALENALASIETELISWLFIQD